MKRLLIGLLMCAHAFGVVAFDKWTDGGYQGSGVHATTVVATGTNLVCTVVVWYRSGTYSVNPTCGGLAMAKIATFTDGYPATNDVWSVTGITAGGTVAVSVSMTVESDLQILTINGAKQSAAFDALGTPLSTTTTTSGAPALITTVAANTLIMWYGNQAGSPSVTCGGVGGTCNNATYLGTDANIGFSFFRSTVNVSSPGPFTLNVGGTAAAVAISGVAISFAPLGPTTISNQFPRVQ